MNIFIIIGAVFIASFAGYLFRTGVERIIDDQIIIIKNHPLETIPFEIKSIFCISIFLFIMSIAVIYFSIEGPF